MSRYSDPKTFQWSQPVVWDRTFALTTVPESAGFYVFTDYSGTLRPSSRPEHTVFYVGQTTNLRRRMRQHQAGPRLQLQTLAWQAQGRNVYLRWAVDERASIEFDLINSLQAVHNDIHSEWS